MLREVHSAQQLFKSRLAAQAGESRGHIDQGHTVVAHIVGLFQPGQGLVSLPGFRVQFRNIDVLNIDCAGERRQLLGGKRHGPCLAAFRVASIQGFHDFALTPGIK